MRVKIGRPRLRQQQIDITPRASGHAASNITDNAPAPATTLVPSPRRITCVFVPAAPTARQGNVERDHAPATITSPGWVLVPASVVA